MEIPALYRAVLRHLNSLPSSKSQSSHIRKLFIEQFRTIGEAKDVVELKRISRNYVKLVDSIKEIKRLRQLDSGEKLAPRDKIKATAARVGLGVPLFSDEARLE